jgi:hypothetical protein
MLKYFTMCPQSYTLGCPHEVRSNTVDGDINVKSVDGSRARLSSDVERDRSSTRARKMPHIEWPQECTGYLISCLRVRIPDHLQ